MFPLLLSSFGVGLIHALAGPDHYIPFIALSRDRGWHTAKTLFIASFASVLHVASSVAIGIAGIALGKELFNLHNIESLRGTIGGYLLITLGAAYTLYAIYKHRKPRIPPLRVRGGKEELRSQSVHNPLSPLYLKGENEVIRDDKKTLAGWTLFSLFVLGPCEPLIPLMFAGVPFGMDAIFWVSFVFSVATLISVNAAVLLGASALKPLAARLPHSFAHLSAGIAILITGITMQFI